MGRARPAGTPAPAPGHSRLGPREKVPTRLGWGDRAQGRVGTVVNKANSQVCAPGDVAELLLLQ